jgi:hypothetical protein
MLSAIAEIIEEGGFATEAQIHQILKQDRIPLWGIELSNVSKRLTEWEVLNDHKAGGYEFAIELIRRWVFRTHPLEKVKQKEGFRLSEIR